jgi:hypothetical protein
MLSQDVTELATKIAENLTFSRHHADACRTIAVGILLLSLVNIHFDLQLT